MILPAGLITELKTTEFMRILLMLAILMIPYKGICQKYISKEAKVTFFFRGPH